MVCKYRPEVCVFADESERRNQSACNFSIDGGNVAETYRFKTGFYGLGYMPNEFQGVMGFQVEHLPAVHVYLDDILIATRGSAEGHWQGLRKLLQVLNENNAAIK